MSVQLSAHFLMSELTVTKTGLLNVPGPADVDNLLRLCFELERWRRLCGPLKVTSGYRSPAVNRAVGGSRTSQHMRGEAADVIPLRGRPQAWTHLLRLMAAPEWLPIDQAIIYEAEPHIHLSVTARYPPRRQILVDMGDGRTVPWETYRGILRPTP